MADLEQRTNEEFEKRREKGSELEEETEAGFFATLKKFSLWDWVKIAGTSAIGIAFGGAGLYGGLLNWGVTSGCYLLAHKFLKKDKIKKSELQAEFHLASLMTPALYGYYSAVTMMTGFILKSIAAMALLPFTVGYMTGMKYLLNKYSPSSFIKDTLKGKTLALPYDVYKNEWKPNYTRTLLEVYKWLGLPIIFVVNYVAPLFQIPIASAVRLAYRLIVGKSESNVGKKEAYEPAPAGAH